MTPRTLVIVNPKSRGGRKTRRWREIERRLRGVLGSLDLAYTRASGDAGRLARDGVRGGADLIVVAGGDGTTNEVAHGLLSSKLEGQVVVAPLALGTGRDFARGLGVTRNLKRTLDALATRDVRRIDAARVTFGGADGNEVESHFVNVASIGLSAVVTERTSAALKRFSGQLSFALGFLRSLHDWRPTPVAVSVDGVEVMRGPADVVAVANGPYFGGGMRLAPSARLDDGLLDVIVVRAMRRARWLAKIHRAYSGSHISLDEVSQYRGRKIEIRAVEGAAPSAPTPIELDGERSGVLPVTFEVLPGALRVCGGSV